MRAFYEFFKKEAMSRSLFLFFRNIISMYLSVTMYVFDLGHHWIFKKAYLFNKRKAKTFDLQFGKKQAFSNIIVVNIKTESQLYEGCWKLFEKKE